MSFLACPCLPAPFCPRRKLWGQRCRDSQQASSTVKTEPLLLDPLKLSLKGCQPLCNSIQYQYCSTTERPPEMFGWLLAALLSLLCGRDAREPLHGPLRIPPRSQTQVMMGRWVVGQLSYWWGGEKKILTWRGRDITSGWGETIWRIGILASPQSYLFAVCVCSVGLSQ